MSGEGITQTENVRNEDQVYLNQWLEGIYGSADPSYILSFEAWQFQVPGWRFYFGSLQPPPNETYAVAVHEGRVLEGEAGLEELLKNKDIYGNPDALPLEKLAGITMFFLSFYGEGDVMLITNPETEGEPWGERVSRLLHKPELTPEDDGHLLQFWYLQQMPVRVSLRIWPNNEMTYDIKQIFELLPPE